MTESVTQIIKICVECTMRKADSKGSRRRSGESQLLFDDIVPSERNDEEDTCNSGLELQKGYQIRIVPKKPAVTVKATSLPKSSWGSADKRPSEYIAGTALTKRIPIPPADVAAD
jgi:hypothetical protein